MAFGDLVILAVSVALATMLRFDTFAVPEQLVFPAILIPVLYFVVMVGLHGYTELDLSILRLGIVRLVFSLIAAYALFVCLSYFLKSSEEISRLWMGYNFALSLGLCALYRLIVGYALFLGGAAGRFHPKFAVIYSPSHRGVLDAILAMTESHGANMAHCVELADGTSVDEKLVAIRRDVPDVVIFAISAQDREAFAGEIETVSALSSELLEFTPITVDNAVENSQGSGLGNAPTEWVVVAGMPFVRKAAQPLAGRGWWIKRAEDLVLSSLFVVLLSPLMVLIALAVRLSSPGPILYRQLRHGFNGDEIVVLKFRSMFAQSCDTCPQTDLAQATRNDPRVTRIGAFLRRTSLDELPQLFNVLRGDMSLVGPRPHATQQRVMYQEKAVEYFSRHRVRPGMTGWAQVNGWRGETDTDEKIRQRVAYDLYYIRNWSIWLDVRILFLTLFIGFTHKNAY